MHFTVERREFVKMMRLLAGKQPGQRRGDEFMRLTSCAARVFVEANGLTCGIEALVMREGSCRIKRELLLKIARSYTPRRNVTIEAEGRELKVLSTTLPIMDYLSMATAPGKFQTFPVTDVWIAQAQLPGASAGQISKRSRG